MRSTKPLQFKENISINTLAVNKTFKVPITSNKRDNK